MSQPAYESRVVSIHAHVDVDWGPVPKLLTVAIAIVASEKGSPTI